jgi:hypothetical protein
VRLLVQLWVQSFPTTVTALRVLFWVAWLVQLLVHIWVAQRLVSAFIRTRLVSATPLLAHKLNRLKENQASAFVGAFFVGLAHNARLRRI